MTQSSFVDLILFTLFINDLTLSSIAIKFVMYAGDTILFLFNKALKELFSESNRNYLRCIIGF